MSSFQLQLSHLEYHTFIAFDKPDTDEKENFDKLVNIDNKLRKKNYINSPISIGIRYIRGEDFYSNYIQRATITVKSSLNHIDLIPRAVYNISFKFKSKVDDDTGWTHVSAYADSIEFFSPPPPIDEGVEINLSDAD